MGIESIFIVFCADQWPVTRDHYKYLSGNTRVWIFDLENKIYYPPLTGPMTLSTHSELKLRGKKLISNLFPLWQERGLKMSFEVRFILTTYTNYFLQLNKMRHQDERRFCIA